MDNFGNRVRKRRLELGLSQQELADRVGYSSRSTITKIESGERNLTQSKIKALAVALDTTTAILMGENDGLERLPEEFIRQIPIYRTVSAGFGACAENAVIGAMPVYIVSDYEADNTICIKVSGDSMYPKIEDGDIITVVRQPSIESGEVGVVLIGDEGLVKRVVYDKNHLELQSINPEYQTRIFSKSEMDIVKIVGRVVQVHKQL